ncbi:hypothetical protein Leryth_012804 [Lithospermum erythrorhizon]|nr:hypothetical protein Leryth_012804 [Lithospermum erythrorhizon]
MDEEEMAMMKQLGIPVGFDSTKGKAVAGNDVGAVRKLIASSGGIRMFIGWRIVVAMRGFSLGRYPKRVDRLRNSYSPVYLLILLML